MTRLQAGDRINNYLLDQRLGTGSFGEVWKAHHHVFGDPVAIKFPADEQFVRHLRQEGLAVRGLSDPHIVRPLDLDPYADPPYLIMEYVDGPALRQLINEHPKGLPIESALAILCGLLQALEAAHTAGVIHRDIKPENILIQNGRGQARISASAVKVTDFGLNVSNELTRQSILQSGSISSETHRHLTGTIGYMSPEQRDGVSEDGIDARTDLYSAGVVLHEMLTGMLPQGSDLPSSMRPEVPRWLDRFFERCYTRRERRFGSAGEMLDYMERYWVAPWPGPASGVRQVAGRRRCAACEGEVRSDDQFCIHCGQQLVEHVPRCPSCHAYVCSSDNFCILCGADLRRSA